MIDITEMGVLKYKCIVKQKKQEENKMTKLVSLEAVERERERESYTLKIKSVTLFNSLTHTHTSNLINKRINIEITAMCFSEC